MVQSQRSTSVDAHQVKALVAKLVQAPSGDNCQPWEYHWDGHELWITINRERANHALDKNRHLTLLTLGAQLATVEVACPGLGLCPEVTILDDALRVCLMPGPSTPHPLEDTLQHRRTHRGRMRRGSSDLPEDISGVRGKARAWVRRPRWSILQKLVPHEARLWTVPGALHDLLRSIYQTGEMSIESLGVGPFSRLGLWLVWQMPWLAVVLAPLGVILGQLLAVRQLWEAEGLVYVTTDGSSPEAVVQCGALATTIWLELRPRGAFVNPCPWGLSKCWNSRVRQDRLRWRDLLVHRQTLLQVGSYGLGGQHRKAHEHLADPPPGCRANMAPGGYTHPPCHPPPPPHGPT